MSRPYYQEESSSFSLVTYVCRRSQKDKARPLRARQLLRKINEVRDRYSHVTQTFWYPSPSVAFVDHNKFTSKNECRYALNHLNIASSQEGPTHARYHKILKKCSASWKHTRLKWLKRTTTASSMKCAYRIHEKRIYVHQTCGCLHSLRRQSMAPVLHQASYPFNNGPQHLLSMLPKLKWVFLHVCWKLNQFWIQVRAFNQLAPNQVILALCVCCMATIFSGRICYYSTLNSWISTAR